MSTDYEVYIGAYLSLDTPGYIETRETVKQCPTCETRYSDDEVYCPKDGSIIVDAHITTTRSIDSWYSLVELFDELEEYDNDFWTPGDYYKVVLLSNREITNSLSDHNDLQIIELSAEVITGYKLKFMAAHEDVLKVMEKLGIEYTIKVGAIGYWS